MANFLYHESCDNCGSRDNLGVWDDGHKWCFGCGYYIPPEGVSVKQVESFFSEKGVNKSRSLDLPEDVSRSIPKEPYLWLKKYQITDKEIVDNNLLWSASTQMLIFPYFGDKNEIIFWQGRFFPQRKPKNYSRGFPDNCLLYPYSSSGSSETVVLVEDPVSAIKVTKFVTCSPIVGSNISLGKAVRLSRYFKHLVVWLDPDKTKEAMKFAERYRPLFESTRFIISEKDPKDHTYEEIKQYLWNGLN